MPELASFLLAVTAVVEPFTTKERSAFVKKLAHRIMLTAALGCLVSPGFAAIEKHEKAAHQGGGAKKVVLWRNPTNIHSRNLFYGPGGKAHEPRGSFEFIKEDLDGTNPKFVVRDDDGVKWKVKMGNEARPETAATRITWAAGYFANEDYFVPVLRVHGMPTHLKRGQNMVQAGGIVRDVRLKREDDKKIGTWEWKSDPFTGTPTWNGLRVVMALMNNWDLKDENNSIYRIGNEDVYMVSDLGASFGSASRTWPKSKSKGDLESYEKSKFISRIEDSGVNFRTPARPSMIYFVNPKEYFSRLHIEWIGRGIPREDVKWMGGILSQLSQQQIRDAFRAAGYSPQEVEGFSDILAKRIAQLTDL
jgi:hypothetical protein